MNIDPFGIEMWMNEFEDNCKYNLAETCIKPLSINELLELSQKNIDIFKEIAKMKMTYGAIKGSERLRSNISSLFEKQNKENVLIAHGAIGANSLVYQTLVSPGDTVVSIMPNYQQHYSIPESLGAKINVVKLKPENNFLPDMDDLKKSVTKGTKLISLSNPNNPTGSVLDENFLRYLVELAITQDAFILCDEVYRGTNQEGGQYSKSICDLYKKGISTGSMSKTYSLAGLRLGWIVTAQDTLDSIFKHRDYNTISVGMINDFCGSLALECKDKIAERNIKIIKDNINILNAWINKEEKMSYVRPKGGTTSLIKYDYDIPSRDFCITVLNETGVLFAPGSAMNMEGWIRIGYANDTSILKEGLNLVSEHLKRNTL